MRICSCDSWNDNIDKFLAPRIILFHTSPRLYEGYLGKLFVYCPWCGKKLIILKDSPQKTQEIVNVRSV